MTTRVDGGVDAIANLALITLTGLLGLAAVLRLAGTVSCWLVGLPAPTAGVEAGLGTVLRPTEPGAVLGSPELSPILFWIVAVVLCAALAVPVGWGLTRWRSRSRIVDARRSEGTATAADIQRTASVRELRRRGTTLRPSLGTRPQPSEVGYLLGTARGRRLWGTVEDSILLLGPPRSGKGLHIVINAILDAPGAVVTTSTRPDNLAVTLRARQRIGPVAVFDPQRLAPGVPAGLKWSPIRGCEDPLAAMIRAAGFAAATGFGDVESGGFWEGKTRAAIQAMLHAAALDGRDARSVYQWALSPSAAAEAVRILATSTKAAEGWAESLDSMIQSDPRTRDSIWQGVGLAFQSLADPRVLAAVTPREGEGFEPEQFLNDRGTLYLLATGAGAGASAALTAAFIEDLVEVARTLAARSAGARLDPPLLLALDEIGNLSPLPSLPTLMAEGGGTGITCLPVLQSLAQARQAWSENAANAIWDASIVKIVLGGASNSRDLQDLATLIGDRDEITDSVTRDRQGGYSSQRSVRRVPILPPEMLRTLPFGIGVVLLRSVRPIVADLRPWTSRPDAAALTSDRRNIEGLLRSGDARTPEGGRPDVAREDG